MWQYLESITHFISLFQYTSHLQSTFSVHLDLDSDCYTRVMYYHFLSDEYHATSRFLFTYDVYHFQALNSILALIKFCRNNYNVDYSLQHYEAKIKSLSHYGCMCFNM